MKPLIAAFLLVLGACAGDRPPSASGTGPAAAGAAAPADPLFLRSDPPRDAAHPARNRQLVIPSGPVRPELGRPAEMNALFLLAAGAGPKPTLLLLHGLPGNERNLDLAQAVRRSGWNVLTFTYRGAWGSEGVFSIQHALADAASALAFLRSAEAANNYAVDAARIVVAGHSMGGYAAAHIAANDPPGDPPLAGLVLLDAWDIADAARRVKAAGAPGRAAFAAALDDLGHALGPITAEDLADNLVRRGAEWDLPALAPRLAGRCPAECRALPVLALYAAHGLAGDSRRFAAALAAAGASATVRALDSDHAFADKRLALAAEVATWLRTIRDAR